MALLKGIERCEYISGVMDNIHYLVWIKDKEGNLIFANKTACELFKEFGVGNILECPVETNGNEKDEVVKLKIDGDDLWLRYSSMSVLANGYDCILVLANDITEFKEKEIKVSKILDEKISEWKEEKEVRSRRLEKNNQEMYAMLNLAKQNQVGILT